MVGQASSLTPSSGISANEDSLQFEQLWRKESERECGSWAGPHLPEEHPLSQAGVGLEWDLLLSLQMADDPDLYLNDHRVMVGISLSFVE